MTVGFQGTPAQFTEAEGRVTEVRAGMDSNLSTLRDRIEATRAGWQGEAQKAFDHVMQRFDEDARGMNQALQKIAELLKEAGSKYERSEQQQQEIMQAVNRGFDRLG
ncbi:WXG100 family type VII secretion target [Amycolatopsis sp. SID8362]|uniref:WXG100 family type VII secretion target n=1 Tax=Amycolatopsis sp. SID8362 TaxID=2690346 RepID=UPI00136DA71E|nr:WXG100 family type VII secretion target [Amycolatopsis sp. SID8362]NBH07816.1 WXG100 family type VII secretion target [Amycolatopsis sp. SID8362]NED44511.1 WXG100 family type VII secretion target [Amycolatopsis sp. SID8362]